ncbi:hypothetical protein AX14_013212 [Amanita brunnescens Koide BX004]|nr:hypothetical protein AX14_013212 [Amanita brunnescens Koide BX004]
MPAVALYFQSWLLAEKWPEIFLMLSMVLAVTSFSFSTILVSSFSDWSGDIKELKSHLLASSILFSIPNIALAWSAMCLFAAAATFSAHEIVFDSPIDYFETAVTILMFFIGLAVTMLFYMVHTIWNM